MHRSTVLSEKGQVVLPKALRDSYRWRPGTRLYVRETPEGLLLTAVAPVKTLEARSLMGITGYRGPARTDTENAAAIRKGVAAHHARA